MSSSAARQLSPCPSGVPCTVVAAAAADAVVTTSNRLAADAALIGWKDMYMPLSVLPVPWYPSQMKMQSCNPLAPARKSFETAINRERARACAP